MVNVGYNYGNKISCPLCNQDEDSQKHMFSCLVMKLKSKELFHMQDSYEDIFKLNDSNMINIANICDQVIKTRELINE